MKNNNTTIIISCAGMGTRLGIGMPKALVDVAGKPLIIRQLEMLNEYDDIRIVVGYQAERIIDLVKSFRKDIMFVFNYDYMSTGTGASFSKGLVGAREYVVALDGDLLVRPSDLHRFIDADEELLGGAEPSTDDPVLMALDKKRYVVGFSREKGDLEWTGLAKVRTARLVPGKGHVYQMLEPLLPIKVMTVHTREIDTMNDYEKAVNWIKNNYQS